MGKQSDFFNGEYYRATKWCMWLVGQWPYQSRTSKWVCLITVLFFIESILIPQGRKLLMVWENMDEILDCIPPMIISLVSTAKILGSAYNNQKVRICLRKIVEDWRSLNSKKEIEILQLYTEGARRLTVIYLVYMLFTGFLYVLQPFLLLALTDSTKSSNVSAESKIPLRVDYGVSIEDYFYPIYFHVAGTVFSHIAIWLAIDMIVVILVQHVCGMFSIVGHMLERIGQDEKIDYQLHVDKNHDKNYWTIFECFRRHNRAIEFAELIESAFTTTFFFVAGFSMVAMSVTGVQAVMHSTTLSGIIKFGALCLAQMFQLLYQCWQAQQLLDHSVYPYECIAKGYWYRTSLRCRKLLQLMLTRKSLPCQLTAGKIYTLSIESFSAVMRTSMSYFTVVRSMQYHN